MLLSWRQLFITANFKSHAISLLLLVILLIHILNCSPIPWFLESLSMLSSLIFCVCKSVMLRYSLSLTFQLRIKCLSFTIRNLVTENYKWKIFDIGFLELNNGQFICWFWRVVVVGRNAFYFHFYRTELCKWWCSQRVILWVIVFLLSAVVSIFG